MKRLTFIDGAIRVLLRSEDYARAAEGEEGRDGILQRLDPRAGVVCAGILLVSAAASRSIVAIAGIFVLVSTLALVSSVPMRALALRVWPGTLLLTAVIVAPALVTTPGTPVLALPWRFGDVTAQGLRSAIFLLARVETAATISYALVVATSWRRLLAALRGLRVPSAVVALLAMTYRYVFLLMRAAHEMLLSRRSRMVGRLSPPQQRALASAMMGSLMMRSLAASQDVHHSMIARGFRGGFDSLDQFRLRTRDGVAFVLVVTIAALTIWRSL